MPLIEENQEVILNNASIDGMQSYTVGQRSYLYASARAAVIQFTKICALNYAEKHVRVNCIYPGIIETNLFTNRGVRGYKYSYEKDWAAWENCKSSILFGFG